MKTKIVLFLAISAVTTLSFTFASVGSTGKKVTIEQNVKDTSTEPVGGLLAEDKI